MSEILRAVLDASCVFSAPCFYSVPIFQPTLGGADQAFPLSGRLQCKSDRWFLMTGVMLFSIAGNARYIESFQYQTLNVFSPNNNKSYYNSTGNMFAGATGENSMNYLTDPEYILWEPNELIGVSLVAPAFDATYQNYVVLGGIEYAR